MAVLVAFLAGGRRILVGRATMAFLARHLRVQADQRKMRDVVIERDALAPVSIAVTGFASSTQLALVWVVFTMTGDAGAGELVAIQNARVAGIALDLRVRAAQRVFGLVVIETRVAPLVLVMACLAFCTVTIRVHVLQPVA